MSNESPYSHLFHLFGQQPEQTVECINAAAFQQLMCLLSRPVEAAGRCVLLRAPRAGYGKSHLLSRVQHQLGGSHEFVLLQPVDGYRVDAETALADVLAKLTRVQQGSGGLTAFDVLARKVLAMGLVPLVRSGQVPCQDCEFALAALHNRPVETFDFQHPTAVTAHWTRDNYELLGPRLVVELSQLLDAPMREVGFWVDVMFRYSVTPLDQPGRAGLMVESVSNAVAVSKVERLSTLLKMLTHLQRVILVADELEGMSANAEAALRLATFVTTLRHGAGRVDIVISVNDDVWENAFLPRLSHGLKDRLSEAEIWLSPMTREQALQLLQSRDSNVTEEQLNALLANGGDLFARGVLRAAAAAWVAMSAVAEIPKANPLFVSESFVAEPDLATTWPPSVSENTFSEPGPSVAVPFPVPVAHGPVVGFTPELEPDYASSVEFAGSAVPLAEEVAVFSWDKPGASPWAGETGPPPPPPVDERSLFVTPTVEESVAAMASHPPFQAVREGLQPTVPAISSPIRSAYEQSLVSEQEQSVQAPWWAECSVSNVDADKVPVSPDVSPYTETLEPALQSTVSPHASPGYGVDNRTGPIPAPAFDFSSIQQEIPSAPRIDHSIVAEQELPSVQTAAHGENPAPVERLQNETSVVPAVPEETPAATRSIKNEIDRVDELLKQFRERYGRP